MQQNFLNNFPSEIKDTVSQLYDTILERSLMQAYKNLDDEKKDITLSQKIEEIKTDIRNKLTNFDFDKYNRLPTNEAKIQYIEEFPGLTTKTKKREIAENFKNYLNYCKKIEAFFDLHETLNITDDKPSIYKNDFTVNSMFNNHFWDLKKVVVLQRVV